MPVPNFLYVGADKAGSTWLYKALRQHPQVFVPSAKDVYFFDREFERGVDWYRGFFADASNTATRIGEICHDYLHDPAVPDRIAETLPEVTILITLREPVDRTRSAYLHHRKVGATALPFRDALDAHPWMTRRSLYADAVARYLDTFGPDRVHVGFFDDLSADAEAFFGQVCAALDLVCPPAGALDLTAEQVARAPRSVLVTRAAKRTSVALRRHGQPALVGRLKHSRLVQGLLYGDEVTTEVVLPEVAADLRERFRADVARLDDLLGRDVSGRWGYRDQLAPA